LGTQVDWISASLLAAFSNSNLEAVSAEIETHLRNEMILRAYKPAELARLATKIIEIVESTPEAPP